MRLVSLERSLVALLSAVIVFICNELVAAKRMGVSEVVVQLDGSSKELECCLVLLLKTVAVAHDAPRLRGEQRFLKSLVRKEYERMLVLQVPQAG